ncbi:hypothetical protein BDA96_06G080100 [Sorghum bicolor]|uniref:Uncharacterized protein n=2 Tax=Sorghum bicolor TaxID=4558 RepID=A0A921QRB8_SORBI|nr:hypothetical protein BDA96_06G080100 [Sorghum bicolor]KXG26262.1 hypothetical protein SORBI_3006G072800 [Sorghum bicolor]
MEKAEDELKHSHRALGEGRIPRSRVVWLHGGGRHGAMDGDLRPPGGRDGWARRGEGAGLWASSSSRRLFDADELTCLPSCGHGRWERKQGQRCGWRAPRTEPGGASSASFASEWAERE